MQSGEEKKASRCPSTRARLFKFILEVVSPFPKLSFY